MTLTMSMIVSHLLIKSKTRKTCDQKQGFKSPTMMVMELWSLIGTSFSIVSCYTIQFWYLFTLKQGFKFRSVSGDTSKIFLSACHSAPVWAVQVAAGPRAPPQPRRPHALPRRPCARPRVPCARPRVLHARPWRRCSRFERMHSKFN